MTSDSRQHVGQSSYIGHLRSTAAWWCMATCNETALCTRHSQRGNPRKSETMQRPYSQLSKSLRKLALHLRHVRNAPTNVFTKSMASLMPSSNSLVEPSAAKLSSPRSVRPLIPRAATAVSVTCSKVHMTQELPSHVMYFSSSPSSCVTSARPSRGSGMPESRAQDAKNLRKSIGSGMGPRFRNRWAKCPSSRPLTGKARAKNHADLTAASCLDSR
mmetsp:Transcript_107315/g.346308  ORF Transcript_107315/g.346308 Transcript_107315/m.346308 type:complete len:216 (+) Transcript_107315:756-1403(+)